MLDGIVNFIFNAISGIVMTGVKILLLPIDALIAATLPSVSQAFTDVANLFTVIGTGFGWAYSLTGFPFSALVLVMTYLIFKLTLPIQFWFFKLALSWYKTLKP